MKLKPIARGAILAAIALLSTGCQTTGGGTLRPVAVSGMPLKLAHYSSLNPDCTSIGATVVRVVKNPDHGTANIQSGVGYTNFAASNPRNQCNFRPTGGTNLVYLSSPGYTGPDSVVVDIIFPSGQEMQNAFNLTVK